MKLKIKFKNLIKIKNYTKLSKYRNDKGPVLDVFSNEFLKYSGLN